MNINATLIGQTIFFIIFVWFCMKFIWPPIVVAMTERKKKIENGLLAAEKAAAAEVEAKEKAAELINQSKNQAAEIIANANQQAKNTIEEAKNIAVVEAEKIENKAISDIEHERNHTAIELKDNLATLVMQGVNQVLAKEVDEKTHKDMLSKLSTTL